MRIALDQFSLSGPGADRGLGRYATTIAAAAHSTSGISVVNVSGSARDDGTDLFAVQRQLGRMEPPPDVYHATAVHHLPLLKSSKWLCTVQDTIPLDLKQYSKLGLKSRALFFNARRSDRILANSEFTATRVQEKLKMSRDRIDICSLPVSRAYFDAPKDLPGTTRAIDGLKYIVAMVDLRTPDPRKRFHWIPAVARALANEDIYTVVVGRGTSAFPLTDHVFRFDNLSDTELAAVYKNAVAFFYPSAYEGQGMPPLEAMAAGAPVVAFQNSAISEMVSEPTFLMEDPSPWRQGNLDSALPSDSLQQIVAQVTLWATDDNEMRSARERAASASLRFDGTEFRAQLQSAYMKFGSL
ncbi:glycosyltransferase involved in cell wall biosynthesis [Microbacterium testaceum]|uniref:glycosyltransferase n=1 Tax=Microbacterium TaxID=33882 RepID=UPI0027833639|nr:MULTISPECIES: glycosyltransferase [Microbacterium]MDQ1110727.1 glycosyltransferase involved in cell wall biosynthesis [Microbacterium testaceum]MDR6098727.1 glycosyltransferase involved in cell wall biosynthesis [Microbacterium sp. SORGH_AS_0454]